MDKVATTERRGIFINGKAQALEILRLLSVSEKNSILTWIKHKDPNLAQELMSGSMTFDTLDYLSDGQLKSIVDQIDARVMGLALKNTKPSIQKRILSLSPRDYAQIAYETMLKNLPNEGVDTGRAQSRVLEIVRQLGIRPKV